MSAWLTTRNSVLSTFNAININYSTLSGSTLNSSTINASTIFDNTITTSQVNYSTLVGSSIVSNVVTGSVIGGNAMTMSTISTATLSVNSSTSTYTTGTLTVVNTNVIPAVSAAIIAPNMSLTGASGNLFSIGQATTLYNSMVLGWFSVGAGSTSNYLNINGYSNITTGGLNITAGGNVGIGTTNPSNLLHLYASNPTLLLQTSVTGYNSGNCNILFTTATASYPLAQIKAIDMGVSPNVYRGDLVFYSQFNTTLNEAMRIQNGGSISVGIPNGTSSYTTGYGLGSITAPDSIGQTAGASNTPNNGTSLTLYGGLLNTTVRNNSNYAGDLTLIAGDTVDNGNTGADSGNYYGGNAIIRSGRAAVRSDGGSTSNPVAGSIYFQVGTARRNPNTAALGGYNDAMMINSNGNVGIGTLSPSAPLHILGSSNGNALSGQLFISDANNTAQQGRFLSYWSGAPNASSYLSIQSINTTAPTYTSLLLNPNGGSVGIGTNTPDAQLSLYSTASLRDTCIIIKSIQPGIRFDGTLSGGGGKMWNIWEGYAAEGVNAGALITYNETNSVLVFILYPNGNATLAGALTQNSDIILKKNIEPVANGLSIISTINPVLYHFKTQSDSEYKHYGMIAQDVQKVLPNLVGESNNGLDSILTLNYIEFIPILISAVKEQNKIIQSQQAQIDSLLTWAKTQGFQ